MRDIERFIDGFQRFQYQYYEAAPSLYRNLRDGQHPSTLLIGCCDSRVDPAMLLGCDPGDIFTVRNVANLVPPADRDQGHHGVLAAIQFAVDQLKVGRIIVLGHAHCGGIRALMERPAGAAGEPDYLNRWMDIAEPARQRVLNQMPDAPDAERRRACEQASILISLRNLESLPSAAGAGGRHADPAWLVFRPGGGRFAGILAARGRLPAHRLPLVHGACMTPVFGIAGRSGSGKTTLIEAMLPLRARAGGQRDQAQPPRFRDGAARQDSARFRQAGAHEVMVASPYRYAIVHELRGGPEPTLAQQLERLAPADLVLVEGFKQAAIPRIEVYRPALGKPALHAEDAGFLAVVTDAALEMTPDATLPCLPLNEPDAVAAFICRTLGLAPGKA